MASGLGLVRQPRPLRIIDFPVTGAEAVPQPLALRADGGGRIPGRRAAGLEDAEASARGGGHETQAGQGGGGAAAAGQR